MCGMRLERIPVPQRESTRSTYSDLVRERVGSPASDPGRHLDIEPERSAPKEVISFEPQNGREHTAPAAPQYATEPPVQKSRPQRAVSGPSFLNLEVPAESPKSESQPEQQTISGPSFLGLADDTPSREGRYNIDYLLEDEPKESHWRLWLVLIILGLFGVLAWLQLRHSGIDVAGLMQRLRQAKLSTVQEQVHPTTGSSDAAPVPDDTSKPASQNQAAAPSRANAAPAANQSSSATNSAQPPAADTSKSDTAKTPDQSKSAPSSDTAVTGNAAAAPAAEIKAPESKPAPPSAQSPDNSPAASDNSGAPADKSPAADQSSVAKKPVTTAKNTPPKKPSASVADSATRAARAQDAQGAALVATGEKYLYGRGVSQSCDRAISYLRKAADMGNAKGSSHLGAMYATGQCLPMDRVRAYKYFAQALHQDSSNHYFQQNLEMLWNEMSPEEKQQATARTPAQ